MMSNRRVYVFSHETARRNAKAMCDLAPEGCIVTFDMEPKKSTVQERKYHAMIRDISKSCKFMNREWDAEDWKRLLIDAFVKVMRKEAAAKNEPEPFSGEGRVIPSLDGEGVVQLGVQSRKFNKKEASEFIEYLYAWGSWNGAVWNETLEYEEVENAQG